LLGIASVEPERLVADDADRAPAAGSRRWFGRLRALGDRRNAPTRIEDPNRRFRAASRRPTRFPPLQRDDRIAAVPSPADRSSPLSGAFRALASLLAHRPGPVPADGWQITLGI